jgi:hypothetical protein
VYAHAQHSQQPIIASLDMVDGPSGGEHSVEDLQIFKDGRVIYTLQSKSGKSAAKSYTVRISPEKIRKLVQLLNLPAIRALPNNLPAKTRPIDFFWDKSDWIDRPEGIQKVHVENFYPFLNLNGKGIDWNSTIDDVKNLYGHPSEDFLDGNSGRLVFPGIDFRFENGKLVRIGIPGR